MSVKNRPMSASTTDIFTDANENNETSIKECNESKENPLRTAGIFSRLLFCWMTPLITICQKRTLQASDLYQMITCDSADHLVKNLRREWEKELIKAKSGLQSSLRSAIRRVIGRRVFILTSFIAVEECIRIGQTLMLSRLLEYYNDDPQMSILHACLYSLGISCAAFSYSFSHQFYFFTIRRLGMQVRVACCSLLYDKMLVLSNDAFAKITTGKIVNIMANDVNRFDEGLQFLAFLFVAPFTTVLMMLVTWYIFGVAGFTGFLVAVFALPAQVFMTQLYANARRKIALKTDARIRLMNDVICAIRTVKMFCWETFFVQNICKLRSDEVKKITYSMNAFSLSHAAYIFSPKLMIYVAVVVYSLVYGSITPAKVFPIIGLFEITRLSYYFLIPMAVRTGSEMIVTTNRIQDLLLADELNVMSADSNAKHAAAVKTQNMCASWKTIPDGFALQNINFHLNPCELLIVIGSVGSGKSSLLLALLQELPLSEGSIHLDGQVAYTSQEPWVFSGSIRKNILFGKTFKVDEYKSILYYTGLEKDIGMMSDGDQTLVGERGVIMSGGQKARIALARTLYADSDIYLFDDPLSAVDSAVGKHIFQKCICDLLRHKTRILVTHHLQYLQAADKILVLDKGRVLMYGPYEQLLNSGIDYTSLLNPPKGTNTTEEYNNVTEQEIIAYSEQFGEIDMPKKLTIPVLETDMATGVETNTLAEQNTALQPVENFETPLDESIQSQSARKNEESLNKCVELEEDIEVSLDEGIEIKNTSLCERNIDHSQTHINVQPVSRIEAETEKQANQHVNVHQLVQTEAATETKSNILAQPVTHASKNTTEQPHACANTHLMEHPSLKFDKSACAQPIAKAGPQQEDHKNVKAELYPMTQPANQVEGKTLRENTKSEKSDKPSPVKESRFEGTVGTSVYLQYLTVGAGVFGLALFLLLNIAVQCSLSASDVWLAQYTEQEQSRSRTVQLDNTTDTEDHTWSMHTYIAIYSGIIASLLICSFLCSYWSFNMLLRSGRRLHDRMFQRIIRCPVAFFDNNPAGRILNRFSSDMGQVDEILPLMYVQFMTNTLFIIGIVVVTLKVNPWVILPTIPLTIALLLYARFYLRFTGDIKRLDGISRSPVVSHIVTSIQGLQTIRAYRAQKMFVNEFCRHVDTHSSVWLSFLGGNRWLAVRLDLICAFFLMAVSFCCLAARQSLSESTVGLALSQSIGLSGITQYCIRLVTLIESLMTSTERIIEYSQLPTEAALTLDVKLPPNWPQNGVIECDGVNLRYADQKEIILKDLHFCIKNEEKVGIVGRTGAGKSSLLTMLFRLAEPTGHITIDGVDILNIGLHQLRDNISVIPQDPVLLTGTLRRNMDPASQHCDTDLWNALDVVEMKRAVANLPSGLSTEISGGGFNFSIGQRQLLCLARALIGKKKIIIMDEATANVDLGTDMIIQNTLRHQFSDCTVLTIAHRLHTIIGYDRIMVMDNGRVVEFGEPYSLLLDKHGMFFNLVQETGEQYAKLLFTQARQAYVELHPSDGAAITHL